MEEKQVIGFLQALQAKNIKVMGDWVSASCVLAHVTHDSGRDNNPSFAVSIEPSGKSRFTCFTCESGSLFDLLLLLKKYGTVRGSIKQAMNFLIAEDENKLVMSIPSYQDKKKKTIVQPWPESYLQRFHKAFDSVEAMEYLKKGRKFSVPDPVIERLGILYDEKLRRVVFPLRSFNRKLVGARGRLIDVEGQKHKMYIWYKDGVPIRNSLPWLGEEKIDLSKPVLFVESCFDMASVLRVYDNVLAPLTVGISKEKVDRLYGVVSAVTLFDNGQGGSKARNIMGRHLDCKVRHTYPTVGVSDPAEMSASELRETLKDYLDLST